MEQSTFSLEKELVEKGYDFVIGVDEAGRGPLAGPVVAGAVMLKCHPDRSGGISGSDSSTSSPAGESAQNDNDKMWDLVRDSKKLSEKQREKVFDFIHENFYVGVGLCNHETIDHINILEASFLAMKKAVAALMRSVNESSVISHRENTKLVILVDGNKQIPNFSMEQKAIVGGDGIVKSISAASIIAKVTRDRLMLEMHSKYPQYQFDKHKGYGTKLHMDMLAQYGPCAIHRRSFAPVRERLMHV